MGLSEGEDLDLNWPAACRNMHAIRATTVTRAWTCGPTNYFRITCAMILVVVARHGWRKLLD